MASEKIIPILQQQLFAADTKTVISAIQTIKKKGNKLYIPILLDVLNSNPEKEIEDEVLDLLATVKDKDAANAFIEAIQNTKYKSILKPLLVSCWQNGLDFCNYTPLFVELIINEDWEIAFEAFTIIDNLEFLPEQVIIEETKLLIESNLAVANEQKAYFLQEILTKLS